MSELKGNGAPDKQTRGALGDIYTDTNTGEQYKCTGAFAFNTYTESKAEFEWRKIPVGNFEKKSLPSNNDSENKKIDKTVKKPYEEPDIIPVEESEKVDRKQSKSTGRSNSKNYNKIYQKKTN